MLFFRTRMEYYQSAGSVFTSLNYTKPLFCIIRNRLMWSVLERFPIKKTAVKTAVSAYLGSLAKIF